VPSTITAVRSGNWSDTSHVTGPWPGGSTPTTKPASGDTVETDAYVITIDENVDIGTGTLRATSSGYFLCATARTIVANIDITGTYTGGGLRFTHTSPNICSLTGNITQNSATANAHTVRNNATGTLNISATTITGGIGAASAVINGSNGSINLTCPSISGGSAGSARGATNDSVGTMTIIGSVTGGSGQFSYGVYNSTTGTITISGTATGGSSPSAYGAVNGNGILNVTSVMGGTVAGAAGLYCSNSAGVATYKQIVSQSNGNSALSGFCKMLVDPTNSITVKRSDTGADYVLVPSASVTRRGRILGGGT
jgi:hypothetical protein